MSLSPLRGRLRDGTSGVDRSQAACWFGAFRPRKGDWSDLWLDVIVRRKGALFDTKKAPPVSNL